MKKSRLMVMRYIVSSVLLFISVLITTLQAQGILPYEIVNSSEFSDDQVYVALLGRVDDQSIWFDASDGSIKPINTSFNTVPGPNYGSPGPGGTNMYADCFTPLSEIPGNTLNLPLIASVRVFISFKDQLYLYFFEDGGYSGPDLANETDPNQGIRFEIIELTYNEIGLWTNTTRVDHYQYPMGLEVWGANDYYKKVGEVLTHQEILDAWKNTVSTPFQVCLDEELGIIHQPSKKNEFKEGGIYYNYFDNYVNQIWDRYQNEDLTIGIGDAGSWVGRVQADGQTFSFTRQSDGRAAIVEARPNTQEIMEGKGVLAHDVPETPTADDLDVQKHFCAAFTRGVIDPNAPAGVGNDWSNEADFFANNTYNEYVKFWHSRDISWEGQTYAFCYDDVFDYSSTIMAVGPTYAKITIGGFAGETPPVNCSLISQGKPATHSSMEGDYTAANAVDGDANTRWASEYSDPQWIMIDLQDEFSICSVEIDWETAAGKAYEIQLSNDINFGTYDVIASETNGDGGNDVLATDNSKTGRYIRMYGTERTTGWGYSIFELRVIGSQGVANIPPVANAGSDQIITEPANQVTVNGSGTDTDGTVVSYLWEAVNGAPGTIESPNSATTVISALPVGVYTYRLTVTDNMGATASDDIVVTVEEQPAVVCSLISLNKPATHSSMEGDYSASNVVDGSMDTRWSSEFSDPQWVMIDLEEVSTICSVDIEWEGASGKVYEIQLSNDVNFGTYDVIASEANGDGGNDNLTTDQTKSGRYIRFYGTERNTGWGYSIWEMEVYGTAGGTNIPPVANAGTDQSITLPVNSVTLNGSGTDDDGTIVSYLWEAINGAAGSIASPNSANTIINGLTAGSHTYKLTVTDNQGATGTDEVTINVISGPVACSLLSQGKTADASTYLGAFTPDMAFDGDINTRWESAYEDPQWISVDLGQAYFICSVEIDWETASGMTYEIQLSNDASFASYDVIASEASGDGGNDLLETDRTKSGRYVRMYGTVRNTGYGYSIFEFKVNGTTDQGSGDTQAPTAPASIGADPAQYACFLSWTPATDNVGVVEYRVYKGQSLEATVDGSNTSMTISGLVPDTEYTFGVRAYDAAGNSSALATVTTRTEAITVDTSAIYGMGNIALSMPVEHSSVQTPDINTGANVTDGDISSRWESQFNDDEWVVVDLGLRYFIGRVILYWEGASGKHYEIQVSDDKTSWETIGVFNSDVELPIEPRTDDFLTNVGAGRYVRMKGIERNTGWGYSLFEFEIYSPGSGPGDIPGVNPNPNPDPVPPAPSSFGINGPTNGQMITDTRRPTLSWQAVSGADRYEVWVNITKTDYDWFKWGSLLDRFTKVGEVTGTSFTLNQDLSDRWTYKWYIAAINGSDVSYSDVGVFSVYMPVVEQFDDGVNLINGRRDLNKDGSIQTYEDWSQPVDVRVSDLMSRMTIEEKAYQMFYNAQAYPIAGWAFGPGTVDDMFNKQKACAGTRLGIPFVSAGDCIHGYGTTYPVQSALAASRNLEITRQCGNMHRVEQKAVGLRGSLSPLAEVGTKVMYPRIQEGCGEDADYAAAQVRAMVVGMQAGPELNPNSIMVTTKHWPGEGAGGEALIVYDGISIKYHMKPWFANVDAGAASVMPGYAGSSFLDPGGPGAGDSKPILDYLRDTVNFQGIVCTDWLPFSAWANTAIAGADVMGGSDPGNAEFSMQEFINEVGEARINEAVERILQVKFRLGVFEDPYGDPVEGPKTWYTEEHENIAIDAARQSMTLLENDGVLPLNLGSGQNLLVTGSRADDGIGQSIWTSYFHEDAGALTMYEAIEAKASERGINTYLNDAPNPSAAVVIIGEPSYTHRTSWEKEMPWIHDAYFEISNTYEYDLTTLNEVDAMGIPYVVVVVMPRPYILTDVKEMANAMLVVYRPGDGGGPALAQLLFGEYAPKGKLPWQLPRSMDQIGTDVVSGQIEKWDLPFDLGATAAERQEIRAKIATGEPILPIYGDPLYQYGYGIQGYTKSAEGHEEGFSAKSSGDNLNVYPNPVANILSIEVPYTESLSGTVSIVSLTGAQVYSESFNDMQNDIAIDVSDLKEGVYILRLQSGNEIKTTRFIKQ